MGCILIFMTFLQILHKDKLMEQNSLVTWGLPVYIYIKPSIFNAGMSNAGSEGSATCPRRRHEHEAGNNQASTFMNHKNILNTKQ